MVKYIAHMLFGAVLLLILQPIFREFIEVKPYTHQEELLVDWDEGFGTLDIQSTFYKNGECNLKTFAVVGVANGVARYLTYTDNDGIPENFNREEGWHLVNISVDISADVYDSVELRTRHTCGGDPTLLNNVYLEVLNGQQIKEDL